MYDRATDLKTRGNLNQGTLTPVLHPCNTSGKPTSVQEPQEETSRIDSSLQLGDVYTVYAPPMPAQTPTKFKEAPVQQEQGAKKALGNSYFERSRDRREPMLTTRWMMPRGPGWQHSRCISVSRKQALLLTNKSIWRRGRIQATCW